MFPYTTKYMWNNYLNNIALQRYQIIRLLMMPSWSLILHAYVNVHQQQSNFFKLLCNISSFWRIAPTRLQIGYYFEVFWLDWKQELLNLGS